MHTGKVSIDKTDWDVFGGGAGTIVLHGLLSLTQLHMTHACRNMVTFLTLSPL